VVERSAHEVGPTTILRMVPLPVPGRISGPIKPIYIRHLVRFADAVIEAGKED